MKTAIGKLSILGLVLLAASAITSAIIPNSIPAEVEGGDNGTIRAGIDGITNTLATCILRDGANFSCNVTIGTTTTHPPEDNSYTGEYNEQTITNTSRSAIVTNQSSIVVPI